MGRKYRLLRRSLVPLQPVLGRGSSYAAAGASFDPFRSTEQTFPAVGWEPAWLLARKLEQNC